jgi:hypothetical protein
MPLFVVWGVCMCYGRCPDAVRLWLGFGRSSVVGGLVFDARGLHGRLRLGWGWLLGRAGAGGSVGLGGGGVRAWRSAFRFAVW